jgi:outer membrane receptor protein involved in Fe transport
VQAEVSSTVGNDTVLARYYHASIYRQTLQGTNANIFDPYPLTIYGTSQGISSPFNGVSAPVYFQDYFNETEQDKLAGWSFEYDHPIGQDSLSFAVDQTNAQSVDYEESTFTSVTVPQGSSQLFTTLQLRGNVAIGPKLQATAVDYYNIYRSTYATSCPYAFGFQICSIDGSNATFTTTTTNHNDPRLGLVFQPNPNLAIRASAGSAIAPPYLSLLSQITAPTANYDPTTGTATITKNGGNIKPETAFGYDLGADFRLPDGETIVSGDIYDNNLYNHFFGESLPSGLTCTSADT